MSPIEERLVRDIAAVTRGVVVNESDLRDARDTIEQRIGGRQQRDRRRMIAVAAAAAVVLAIGGVATIQALGGDEETAPPAGPPVPTDDTVEVEAPAGTAPTISTLKGIWRVDNGTTLIRFGVDGAVRFDPAGALWSDPLDTGSYAIEGKQITITTAGDKIPACRGAETVLSAAHTGEGSMEMVYDSGTDTACSPLPGTSWVMEQVLPTRFVGFLGLRLTAGEVRAMEPPTDQSLLPGDWVAQGGGHLLELAADGTYYVAGAGADVVDQGRWTLDLGTSELRLVSSEESVLCEAGDALVLTGVRYLGLGPTSVFGGSVAQNPCDAKWTPEYWWVLPNDLR